MASTETMRSDVTVYVVRCAGMVKVGATRRALATRLMELRRDSGHMPVVVEIRPGSVHLERHIQRALGSGNSKTEWFPWRASIPRELEAALNCYVPPKRRRKMVSDIGRRLRKARLERNITQTQLASVLGCSQEMIVFIENGQKEPGMVLLPKINKWISSGAGGKGVAPRGPYRT